MIGIIRGKVWRFGDHVDTDAITPALYMDAPMEEMKRHVMESLNPNFAGQVKAGDVIVAGKNFGCGSSRQTAPDAIKALYVGAVIAESFARIFFRNAVAIGLPIFPCPGVAGLFEEAEEVELDIPKALVTNSTRNIAISGPPLPGDILDILSRGGILALLEACRENKEINPK